MSFHPYLFFSNGECAEAFRRYHEIFGGELQVMTNADAPEGVDPMPGAEPGHVMHAAIELGKGSYLMGSDDPTGDGGPKTGVAVTFATPDEQEGKRVFEALAEGGEVFMPFEPTFFSKGFGSCVDRWGVNWMVDTSEPEG
ncbi:MAG TPA: VOC family protein [Acidimicrobiales bacterium]|nr:VOC family protein [Acidimicrobiales bacterium]